MKPDFMNKNQQSKDASDELIHYIKLNINGKVVELYGTVVNMAPGGSCLFQNMDKLVYLVPYSQVEMVIPRACREATKYD